jgi:integrase
VIVPTQAVINLSAEQEKCSHLKVKRFPVETKAKTPATWEWVQAFMAHSSPHLGALACFMFLTGARISEALALTWADVDLPAGKALVKQTKIGAERLRHFIMQGDDGRFFPVFVGERALQAMVHFHFHVVA